MDAFVKRACPDGDNGAGKRAKVTDRPRPVFVVGPGASGTDPKLLREALATMGKVAVVEKWVGNFPGQMEANVGLLEDLADAEVALLARTKTEDGPVVLVGHSFGCRVVAELMKKESSFGIGVMESYPLFGPKRNDPDRVAPLLGIPRTSKLCFVSGCKDDFLDRKWQKQLDPVPPVGIAALESLAFGDPNHKPKPKPPMMSCTCSVVGVEGAGHNALDSKRKSKALSLDPKAIFIKAVADLLQTTISVSAAAEEEQEQDTQPATTTTSPSS